MNHEEHADEAKKQLSLSPSPFELLAKKRILWLNDEVNDETMGDIASRLFLMSQEDPESDITLFINSPGGSISSGLMLYDMMNLIPNDIVTVATGMAASMGQFLLTVGAPGKRFITPNARVLLHQPLGGFSGTASDIKGQAELILRMKKQLATITAERTGKTVEQIHEDGDRDKWFNADESLEYGFVDHIITNLSELDKMKDKKATAKTTTTKKPAARKTPAKKS